METAPNQAPNQSESKPTIAKPKAKRLALWKNILIAVAFIYFVVAPFSRHVSWLYVSRALGLSKSDIILEFKDVSGLPLTEFEFLCGNGTVFSKFMDTIYYGGQIQASDLNALKSEFGQSFILDSYDASRPFADPGRAIVSAYYVGGGWWTRVINRADLEKHLTVLDGYEKKAFEAKYNVSLSDNAHAPVKTLVVPSVDCRPR